MDYILTNKQIDQIEKTIIEQLPIFMLSLCDKLIQENSQWLNSLKGVNDQRGLVDMIYENAVGQINNGVVEPVAGGMNQINRIKWVDQKKEEHEIMCGILSDQQILNNNGLQASKAESYLIGVINVKKKDDHGTADELVFLKEERRLKNLTLRFNVLNNKRAVSLLIEQVIEILGGLIDNFLKDKINTFNQVRGIKNILEAQVLEWINQVHMICGNQIKELEQQEHYLRLKGTSQEVNLVKNYLFEQVRVSIVKYIEGMPLVNLINLKGVCVKAEAVNKFQEQWIVSQVMHVSPQSERGTMISWVNTDGIDCELLMKRSGFRRGLNGGELSSVFCGVIQKRQLAYKPINLEEPMALLSNRQVFIENMQEPKGLLEDMNTFSIFDINENLIGRSLGRKDYSLSQLYQSQSTMGWVGLNWMMTKKMWDGQLKEYNQEDSLILTENSVNYLKHTQKASLSLYDLNNDLISSQYMKNNLVHNQEDGAFYLWDKQKRLVKKEYYLNDLLTRHYQPAFIEYVYKNDKDTSEYEKHVFYFENGVPSRKLEGKDLLGTDDVNELYKKVGINGVKKRIIERSQLIHLGVKYRIKNNEVMMWSSLNDTVGISEGHLNTLKMQIEEIQNRLNDYLTLMENGFNNLNCKITDKEVLESEKDKKSWL